MVGGGSINRIMGAGGWEGVFSRIWGGEGRGIYLWDGHHHPHRLLGKRRQQTGDDLLREPTDDDHTTAMPQRLHIFANCTDSCRNLATAANLAKLILMLAGGTQHPRLPHLDFGAGDLRRFGRRGGYLQLGEDGLVHVADARDELRKRREELVRRKLLRKPRHDLWQKTWTVDVLQRSATYTPTYDTQIVYLFIFFPPPPPSPLPHLKLINLLVGAPQFFFLQNVN